MNYEIERKFLVKLPDTEYILKNFNAEASKITQTYLDVSDKDINARVRKREFSSKTEYTYTEKKRISDIKRIENEMGRALKQGKKVEYTVMPHYPNPTTLRPDKFTIRYTIDGVQKIRRVTNV